MMEFTKMHGLGNDFVVVYGEQELPSNASERAVKLCNRFFGIGADGLVYILPSSKADFMMRIMNSDGSEAEQCGNAIRCVAKYVYDHGYIDREEITIETIGAGVQQVRLTVQDGQVSGVRVDMGEPVLDGLSVPTLIDLHPVVNHPIEVDGREFRFTAVSMGIRTASFMWTMPLTSISAYGGPNLRCIRSSRERSTWSLRRSTHGASRYAGMGARCRADLGLRHRRLRNIGVLGAERIDRSRRDNLS